jgi:hypothetical protein
MGGSQLIFNPVDPAVYDHIRQIDYLPPNIIDSQSAISIHDHGDFMLVSGTVDDCVAARGAQDVAITITYIFDHGHGSNPARHSGAL